MFLPFASDRLVGPESRVVSTAFVHGGNSKFPRFQIGCVAKRIRAAYLTDHRALDLDHVALLLTQGHNHMPFVVTLLPRTDDHATIDGHTHSSSFLHLYHQ